MPDTSTPKLGLTDLVESQASAEVRVNENMRIIDTLLCCVVLDRDLATPPGSPSDGDAYLVAASGTGDWSSKDGDIAYWNGTTWKFITPAEGFVLRVADENIRIEYDGAAWQRIWTSAEHRMMVLRDVSPVNNREVAAFYTTRPITITSVTAVYTGPGGSSITWNLKHDSNREASGTSVFTTDPTCNSNTSGVVSNSGFNDATIASGRFVWAQMTSAPSGTMFYIELYIQYTEDAP